MLTPFRQFEHRQRQLSEMSRLICRSIAVPQGHCFCAARTCFAWRWAMMAGRPEYFQRSQVQSHIAHACAYFPTKKTQFKKKIFCYYKNVLLFQSATVCTSNYGLYWAIKFITPGVVSIAPVTSGYTFRASWHTSTVGPFFPHVPHYLQFCFTSAWYWLFGSLTGRPANRHVE